MKVQSPFCYIVANVLVLVLFMSAIPLGVSSAQSTTPSREH